MKTYVGLRPRKDKMLFNKRRCPNCNRVVKEGWKFCPYCGEELIDIRTPLRTFRSMFADADREFERLVRMFGLNLQFPRVSGGGVSITIRSGSGVQPEVKIKTYGDYKKFEPELKRKLGIKEGVKEIKEERKLPKITEEPKTIIQNLGDRRVVTIELPGVKDERDVEIRKLEQSVEVKAFAKDKAYFKLLPIPKGASVESEFKDERLILEIRG